MKIKISNFLVDLQKKFKKKNWREREREGTPFSADLQEQRREGKKFSKYQNHMPKIKSTKLRNHSSYERVKIHQIREKKIYSERLKALIFT